MLVKVIYASEGATIPQTAIGLGLGFISVWIDGRGFTSATNTTAFGYVLLNTPEIDIGHPGDEVAAAFADLHGRLVSFEIAPQTFVSSGGIARIKMAVQLEVDGALVEQAVEFFADNCRGIAVSAGAATFVAEMFQTLRSVAEADSAVPEDELVAIIDAAPSEEEVFV